MSNGSRRAFTLIEVLVSIALLGVGIVAVLGAFGQITGTESRARQHETMLRLAAQKYDELIGTSQMDTAALDGDFRDSDQPDYSWTATLEPTGTENLESLRVTVSPTRNRSGGVSETIEGLVYRVPQTAQAGQQ